jgi:hypothetical protein
MRILCRRIYERPALSRLHPNAACIEDGDATIELTTMDELTVKYIILLVKSTVPIPQDITIVQDPINE